MWGGQVRITGRLDFRGSNRARIGIRVGRVFKVSGRVNVRMTGECSVY